MVLLALALHGLGISPTYPPGSPSVRSQSVRIEQCLENASSRSARALGPGSHGPRAPGPGPGLRPQARAPALGPALARGAEGHAPIQIYPDLGGIGGRGGRSGMKRLCLAFWAGHSPEKSFCWGNTKLKMIFWGIEVRPPLPDPNFFSCLTLYAPKS